MFSLKYDTPSESQQQQPSLQMRAQALLLLCQSLGNPENKKATLLIIVGIIGVAGIAALFSTAFSTCSKISLENQTTESIAIYTTAPYGTKVSSTLLLPYTTITIKLNGFNSYADLYTTAGEMHFSDFGKKGTLKEGAHNKEIETGSPAVFFWVCNQNYIKTSEPSNETTSSSFFDNTSHISDMQESSNLFTKTPGKAHLRGSLQDESKTGSAQSSLSIFKANTHRWLEDKPPETLTQSI